MGINLNKPEMYKVSHPQQDTADNFFYFKSVHEVHHATVNVSIYCLLLVNTSIKKIIKVQSTLDISNYQGANKFVQDIESSTYRVVILCKLIRM